MPLSVDMVVAGGRDPGGGAVSGISEDGFGDRGDGRGGDQTRSTEEGIGEGRGEDTEGEIAILRNPDIEHLLAQHGWESNADLEEFFRKRARNTKDVEFDMIYVNGGNNLENMKREDEAWKVRLIEEEFGGRMFIG
jgi:hypothetical protein